MMWICQIMCYKVQQSEAKRDFWMVFVQTAGSIFNVLATALLGKFYKSYSIYKVQGCLGIPNDENRQKPVQITPHQKGFGLK